ncbi:MAG: undecaprenyl-diphosphate phosphatase [Oscillospiraceae bacterium]|nr:undecaprenyl-diphosphate phosphatase [Oscillospiraceae bacterium]
MNILQAVQFGLIQGITEFIPVSSAAHLCILFNLFGLSASGFNVKAFSVFLHFGTILAAFISYWQDFGEVFFQSLEFAASGNGGEGGPKRRSFPAARLMIMMVFSVLPLVMLLPLQRYISRLFDMNGLIGVMLVLTGLILFVSDRLWEREKTERNMSLSDAIIIGLCQMVSSIPGISRTGIVYTAGVAVGLKRDFAAKYAIMLSVPVMFVANIIRLVDAASTSFALADIPVCLVGMAAALGSGVLSIRVFRALASKGKLRNVGYYCCVAGVLSVILTMIF